LAFDNNLLYYGSDINRWPTFQVLDIHQIINMAIMLGCCVVGKGVFVIGVGSALGWGTSSSLLAPKSAHHGWSIAVWYLGIFLYSVISYSIVSATPFHG